MHKWPQAHTYFPQLQPLYLHTCLCPELIVEFGERFLVLYSTRTCAQLRCVPGATHLFLSRNLRRLSSGSSSDPLRSRFPGGVDVSAAACVVTRPSWTGPGAGETPAAGRATPAGAGSSDRALVGPVWMMTPPPPPPTGSDVMGDLRIVTARPGCETKNGSMDHTINTSGDNGGHPMTHKARVNLNLFHSETNINQETRPKPALTLHPQHLQDLPPETHTHTHTHTHTQRPTTHSRRTCAAILSASESPTTATPPPSTLTPAGAAAATPPPPCAEFCASVAFSFCGTNGNHVTSRSHDMRITLRLRCHGDAGRTDWNCTMFEVSSEPDSECHLFDA